jgi:hypothetical protein
MNLVDPHGRAAPPPGAPNNAGPFSAAAVAAAAVAAAAAAATATAVALAARANAAIEAVAHHGAAAAAQGEMTFPSFYPNPQGLGWLFDCCSPPPPRNA